MMQIVCVAGGCALAALCVACGAEPSGSLEIDVTVDGTPNSCGDAATCVVAADAGVGTLTFTLTANLGAVTLSEVDTTNAPDLDVDEVDVPLVLEAGEEVRLDATVAPGAGDQEITFVDDSLTLTHVITIDIE